MAQLIYKDEELGIEIAVTVDTDATAYHFVDVAVATIMRAIGYHPDTVDRVINGEEQ